MKVCPPKYFTVQVIKSLVLVMNECDKFAGHSPHLLVHYSLLMRRREIVVTSELCMENRVGEIITVMNQTAFTNNSSKHLLRSISHVKKSIVISVLTVNLGHSLGHASHRLVADN